MRGIILPVLLVSITATAQAPATYKPYSIDFEQKTEQTLADGTHIVHVNHQKRLRDSTGRTRMETTFGTEDGGPERTSVILFDPSAKQTISWTVIDEAEKFYHVSTMHTMHPVTGQPGQPRHASPQRPQQMRESLGTSDVQGTPCRATRVTFFYPAGMLGNDQPFRVVRETCVSQEFGLSLQDTTVDPRRGTISLTATAISGVEPEPSQFQPPPGYTERKPN